MIWQAVTTQVREYIKYKPSFKLVPTLHVTLNIALFDTTHKGSISNFSLLWIIYESPNRPKYLMLQLHWSARQEDMVARWPQAVERQKYVPWVQWIMDLELEPTALDYWYFGGPLAFTLNVKSSLEAALSLCGVKADIVLYMLYARVHNQYGAEAASPFQLSAANLASSPLALIYE